MPQGVTSAKARCPVAGSTNFGDRENSGRSRRALHHLGGRRSLGWESVNLAETQVKLAELERASTTQLLSRGSATTKMVVVRDHAAMASSPQPEPAPQPRPPSFVTHSRAMARAVALADRVAELGASALVVGESGTGKRRLLRRVSMRPNAPPRPESIIDCRRSRRAFSCALEQISAVTHPIWRMPTRLQLIGLDDLEVEQFDALERAIWGGIYLCTPNLQLLATSAVGADELATSCSSAARVVAAATNEIVVPPLRERGPDLPSLAHAILKHQCATAGIARMRVAPDASELLRRYAWPGNFPELEEVLGWATTTADPSKRRICTRDLPSSLQEGAFDSGATSSPSEEGLTLAELEKRHILATLERFDGRRRDAAQALAISENTLWRRLREYGVVGARDTASGRAAKPRRTGSSNTASYPAEGRTQDSARPGAAPGTAGT